MKTKKMLLLTVIVLVSAITAIAQNPITTLQHAGTTQVFYGQNSFVEAYNASVNGDTINLSVGGFTPPPTIAKGITIIGAGHFPDSTSLKIRTTVTRSIYIYTGADSLHLEGLYINGDIIYSSFSSSISNVKILRCRLFGTNFSNNCTLNNCSYEECIIDYSMYFDGRYGSVDNFLVKHCIIYGGFAFSGLNAVIDGNIHLINTLNPQKSISNAIIKNNIFLTSFYNFNVGTNNVINNNLFVADSVNFTNDYSSNNYLGVPQADIFVNQTGNVFDYSHNYHLKNPELYIGTDGTQVGLYGGPIPFKDGGLPSNPQITSKSIATETDASGNLNINFSVQAQEN